MMALSVYFTIINSNEAIISLFFPVDKTEADDGFIAEQFFVACRCVF